MNKWNFFYKIITKKLWFRNYLQLAINPLKIEHYQSCAFGTTDFHELLTAHNQSYGRCGKLSFGVVGQDDGGQLAWTGIAACWQGNDPTWRGKIINIASQGGLVALAKHIAYNTSKGGLIAMTKVLALELTEFAFLKAPSWSGSPRLI